MSGRLLLVALLWLAVAVLASAAEESPVPSILPTLVPNPRPSTRPSRNRNPSFSPTLSPSYRSYTFEANVNYQVNITYTKPVDDAVVLASVANTITRQIFSNITCDHLNLARKFCTCAATDCIQAHRVAYASNSLSIFRHLRGLLSVDSFQLTSSVSVNIPVSASYLQQYRSNPQLLFTFLSNTLNANAGSKSNALRTALRNADPRVFWNVTSNSNKLVSTYSIDVPGEPSFAPSIAPKIPPDHSAAIIAGSVIGAILITALCIFLFVWCRYLRVKFQSSDLSKEVASKVATKTVSTMELLEIGKEIKVVKRRESVRMMKSPESVLTEKLPEDDALKGQNAALTSRYAVDVDEISRLEAAMQRTNQRAIARKATMTPNSKNNTPMGKKTSHMSASFYAKSTDKKEIEDDDDEDDNKIIVTTNGSHMSFTAEELDRLINSSVRSPMNNSMYLDKLLESTPETEQIEPTSEATTTLKAIRSVRASFYEKYNSKNIHGGEEVVAQKDTKNKSKGKKKGPDGLDYDSTSSTSKISPRLPGTKPVLHVSIAEPNDTSNTSTPASPSSAAQRTPGSAFTRRVSFLQRDRYMGAGDAAVDALTKPEPSTPAPAQPNQTNTPTAASRLFGDLDDIPMLASETRVAASTDPAAPITPLQSALKNSVRTPPPTKTTHDAFYYGPSERITMTMDSEVSSIMNGLRTLSKKKDFRTSFYEKYNFQNMQPLTEGDSAAVAINRTKSFDTSEFNRLKEMANTTPFQTKDDSDLTKAAEKRHRWATYKKLKEKEKHFISSENMQALDKHSQATIQQSMSTGIDILHQALINNKGDRTPITPKLDSNSNFQALDFMMKIKIIKPADTKKEAVILLSREKSMDENDLIHLVVDDSVKGELRRDLIDAIDLEYPETSDFNSPEHTPKSAERISPMPTNKATKLSSRIVEKLFMYRDSLAAIQEKNTKRTSITAANNLGSLDYSEDNEIGLDAQDEEVDGADDDDDVPETNDGEGDEFDMGDMYGGGDDDETF